MPTRPPIVALLTDFGTRDAYVGAMKGAILTACPRATIVDISHEVPAHDVTFGAYCLHAAAPAFPRGTVFVAVVDPGVGSKRRGLALKAGGHLFVGPDNGILTLILAEHPKARARALANARLFLPRVSLTFHGRDVFGPVAGVLARGARLAGVGPEVRDPIVFPIERARERRSGDWEATVIDVDRFGNLITNLTARDVDVALRRAVDAGLVVWVKDVRLPLVRTYSDIPEGAACALLGSSGRLEVAINRGSAARRFKAGAGTRVHVLSRKKRVT